MENKVRTCKYCDKMFTDVNVKIFANHVRWCDKNTTNGDKGGAAISKAAHERHDRKLGKVQIFTKTCMHPDCDATFTVECRKIDLNSISNYCSLKCRNSIGAHADRIWTDDMRSDASERSKLLWIQQEYRTNIMKTTGNRRFTSKGEEEVREYFKTNFPDDEWTHGGSLKMGDHRLVRDLFSKKLKICIEYDGIWHFKDIKGQLDRKQSKDAALQEWCLDNGWRLIRIDENVYKSDKQYAISLLESYVYDSHEPVVKIGDRYTID